MRLHIIDENLNINSVLKGTVSLANPHGNSDKLVIGIDELYQRGLPVMSVDNLVGYARNFNVDFLLRTARTYDIEFYLKMGTVTSSVEDLILSWTRTLCNEIEIVEHHLDRTKTHTANGIKTKLLGYHPNPIHYLLQNWIDHYKVSNLVAYVPTHDHNGKDEKPPVSLPIIYQLLPPVLNEPIIFNINVVLLDYTNLSIKTISPATNKLIEMSL